MSENIESLKKLLPFCKTVILYFVVAINSDASIFNAILKCLPILSLMYFVSRNGEGIHNDFNKKIFHGLLFSCIGDFCLVWNKLFELGMISFLIGHINYILAFGFEPIVIPLGFFIYILGGNVIYYLLPDLQGVLFIGIPIYVVVISTLIWRAAARLKFESGLSIFTLVGTILFGLSDLIIAINKFKFDVDYAQEIIMSTYYVAQLGISLSVLNS